MQQILPSPNPKLCWLASVDGIKGFAAAAFKAAILGRPLAASVAWLEAYSCTCFLNLQRDTYRLHKAPWKSVLCYQAGLLCHWHPLTLLVLALSSRQYARRLLCKVTSQDTANRHNGHRRVEFIVTDGHKQRDSGGGGEGCCGRDKVSWSNLCVLAMMEGL